MRKIQRFFWAACLVIIVSGAAACDRASPFRAVRNLDAPGENLVCFGDSLTEGVGVSPDENYPAVVARRLGRRVINAGRSGDTSADGLHRLEADVLAHNPRLVIVLFGGNDFLRRVPIDETRKNIDEMVRRIQERGAMVVLAGMRLGFFTDEYSPLYEEIAGKNGAILIPDILDGLLSDSRLRSDSIHPNGSGYRVVAERVVAQVKPLLEEADRKRSRSRE
jgi:acyl-CoA thioesterase-1